MQLGEIFLPSPEGTDSPGTGEVVHSTRRGTVAPQGRMRGACAAEPREEAIAARPPLISPLCGQLPPRGKPFRPSRLFTNPS